MSRVAFENNQFIFCEEEKETVLLDLCEHLSNKSRIPLHGDPSEMSILQLLIGLQRMHGEIGGRDEDVLPSFLMDILLTSYLIRTSTPIKAVELGALDGVLSFHMATLMGRFHEGSSLCCVSNVIGNESGNCWLDRICMVEQPPVLSMLASDYENTQLESDYFDLVVINGTVSIDNPYEVVREAERLIKKGGFLICHAKDNPLLESSFELIFPKRREYQLSADEKILTFFYEGTSWGKEKPDFMIFEEEINILLQETQSAVTAKAPVRDLRILKIRYDSLADKAVKLNDGGKKDALLCMKEYLIDYILNEDESLEEYYRERILAKLHNIQDSREFRKIERILDSERDL